LGIGDLLLLITAVIEEKLEFAFQLVDVNDDSIFRDFFDFLKLDSVKFNTGKEKPDERRGNNTDIIRQKPIEVVVGALEKNIRPFSEPGGYPVP
jgi:hypothetical protein